MAEQLGERQGTVLRAVVKEYIRTGEPVGSKEVVRRSRLGVSSATVRGDMARLTDMLYLLQPHTSAGRIPTDLGYRFFVDNIENPVRLEQSHERTVADEMGREPESLEDLLQRATDVLSRITRSAAAVLAPRLTPSRLRHLDLVGMGPGRVMVVMVADNGRVEQRLVALERDVAAPVLERVSRELNKDLENVRVDEARRRLAARIERASDADRPLLREVADTLEGALQGGDRLYFGGAARLADQEELARETLHGIYEVLEQQQTVLALLADALSRSPAVRIGSEIPVEEMRECSVVMANYEVAGSPIGSIGVIGPTRMDYRRALASTQSVARALGRTLDEFAT